jgi:hypothetical protein
MATLIEALESALGKSPQIEPLTNIGALARVFAREPGAPAGNWRDEKSRAHAYVNRRLADSAGVDIRSAQRWTTAHGIETRNISKKNMAKLQVAATISRDKTLDKSVLARLDRLEKTGAIVDLSADIVMLGPNTVDVRHRRIQGVFIEPDMDLPEDEQLWSNFLAHWRAGDLDAAAIAFQNAYFTYLAVNFTGWNESVIEDVDYLQITGAGGASSAA